MLMTHELSPSASPSQWRVAAMRFVGAAARATDREERVHYLLCASECLDRAERLVIGRPDRAARATDLH
jgi:hypothetical protein